MDISDVSTVLELADFLKIPRQLLTYILYNKKPDSYYYSFEIPKRSGGTRTINAPVGALKDVQLRLKKVFSDCRKEAAQKRNISHAFEEGKSIYTNAKRHRNKRYVINFDLNDFFGSFHFGRVLGFFRKNRRFSLPYEVSVALAQLLCYQGALPQGAPTSPIVTNMICDILDIRLLKIAKRFHLDYTRYADDLTFSTNDKHIVESFGEFYSQLQAELKSSGFSVNEKKTSFQFKDSRQTVTGLTVNKKIQVPREYYKTTRAMAMSLYKTVSFTIDGEEGTLEQLRGRFSFIDMLEKLNNKADGKKHSANSLSAREEQYRRFLFYTTFYRLRKPLILTEGKTDIVYLKAALKKLYKDYPLLITELPNGRFNFNVTFLNRTKKLAYLFDYSQTGADAGGNLYRYFSGKGSSAAPNYYDYFHKLSETKPQYPIIFVFDNELSNKEKPLGKFMSQKDRRDRRGELESTLAIRLEKDKNLYLTTNPLASGEKEAEIESLFDEATRNTKINGRTLSLANSADNTLYYGKDEFSKYIYKNYQSINFDRFRPMLDNICKIISEYGQEE